MIFHSHPWPWRMLSHAFTLSSITLDYSLQFESAQQDKGYSKGHAKLFDVLADFCKKCRVSFLGGDFNMALFVVPEQMWSRSLETRWCGSYAWRKADSATSSSPAVAGQLRFDSMGFFALGPAPRVEPWISMLVLSDEHSQKHLETFPNGQGYEASSYCGGM